MLCLNAGNGGQAQYRIVKRKFRQSVNLKNLIHHTD